MRRSAVCRFWIHGRPGSSSCDSSADFPLTKPRRRSEEHTSELQSHSDLVCRLLLEKKKNTNCYVSKAKNHGFNILPKNANRRGSMGHIKNRASYWTSEDAENRTTVFVEREDRSNRR